MKSKRIFYVTMPEFIASKIESYCKDREISFNRYFRDLAEKDLRHYVSKKEEDEIWKETMGK